MKVIYKYELRELVNHIQLPVGAKILSAGGQRDTIQLWAEVDPNQKVTEQRTFRVAPTGDQYPDGERTLISLVMLNQGNYIFHVFEEIRK